MDELVIDNLVYIPSKRAAAITGYAKDYIGQLCREGRIEAKLVGRSWYVLESSIREHRFGITPERPQEPAETQPEAMSAAQIEEQPEAPSEPIAKTWESPVYIAETPEPIPLQEDPTSLENPPQIPEPVSEAPTQIQEVQNAWQEWFAKNNQVSVRDRSQDPVTEPASQPASLHVDDTRLETASTEDQTDASADREEEAAPVRIHRSYPGSMDIGSVAASPDRSRDQKRAIKSSVRKNRMAASPAGGRLVLQAIFIGIIVITLAVTVIGTGSLDAFNPTWASNPGAVNYLAGVRIIEK